MRSHIRLLLVGALALPATPPFDAFATECGKGVHAEQPAAKVASTGEATSAYRLALSLEAEGKAKASLAAYRRVLRLDPEHRAARRSLGYELVKGEWTHASDALKAKGFVQDAGRWVLREELTSSLIPGKRKEALKSLAKVQPCSTVEELSKSLSSSSESTRIRSAEALGRLGDSKAYPYLIKTWEKRSGNFPGGYFSQTKQVAYLQDFDVEVA